MGPAFTILVAALAERPDAHVVPLLASYGYLVLATQDVSGLLKMAARSIDLVILDLPTAAELPHMQTIQEAFTCPVIVLGPARDRRLMVAALEQGAADYVQRPFNSDELLARVRAQLRRHDRGLGVSLALGTLTIDPHERKATRDGLPLNLSPEEYALLATLASQPGYACPAALLLERVWGRDNRKNTALLAATVTHLRDLIEPDPRAPTLLGGSLSQGYWLGGDSREREINAR